MGYLLYIGGYLDKTAVVERGLPTHNTAGSNRVRRIAEALVSAGQKVIVISPAASMRMRWSGRLIHPPRAGHAGRAPVLFSAALGLPVLGALIEPLFLLLSLQYAKRARAGIQAVMIYNFSPSLLIAALWVRLVWGVKLINDLEDISAPRLKDWLSASHARPVQQIVLALCMKAIVRLSEKIVIPTRVFASRLPLGKHWFLVAGCLPSFALHHPDPGRASEGKPVRILLSCGMEFEKAIAHLMNGMRMLAEKGIAGKGFFRLDICGHNPRAGKILEKIEKPEGVDIVYHGFLEDTEYLRFLSSADICVELSDPSSRFADRNTPSKLYEYLGAGKMVIATAVGDIPRLPEEVIELWHPFNAGTIYEKLAAVASSPETISRFGEEALRYAQDYFSYPVVGPALKEFILRPLW